MKIYYVTFPCIGYLVVRVQEIEYQYSESQNRDCDDGEPFKISRNNHLFNTNLTANSNLSLIQTLTQAKPSL